MIYEAEEKPGNALSNRVYLIMCESARSYGQNLYAKYEHLLFREGKTNVRRYDLT
jgi:hypothetical protein